MEKWWQGKNIYQIYLRSFFDSNHDGIGDLQGVIAKLDYLQECSIEIIWISPHYHSPMDDNGYDVADFYQVSKDYGTLEDFKKLLDQSHQRGMKVITDLILNHTSDEHPWFQKASDPTHPEYHKYHDYYIWHQGVIQNGKRIPPTRWMGWFGSPVWKFHPQANAYYLHIFSEKMPDLNWRNPHMRQELKEMIQFWIDLGVDGFRIDASNHLEKNWDFPDDFPGYQHFSSLPKHHEYLQELGKELFVPNDLLIIGESGGASKEEAIQYAGYHSNEFNMLIQFGHCWADVDETKSNLMGKWAKGDLRVSSIKKSFNHWYEMLHNEGWNVIYWHNHDQPRIVSHYGNDQDFWFESASMLAVALYFMPGSVIVYQGEEIGMKNVDYQQLHQFRDVEVFTEYQNMMKKGLSHEDAMQVLRDRCRDNARTPMQWDYSPYSGFSSVHPWIDLPSHAKATHVAKQSTDPHSLLQLYRFLLKLRKENQNITHGTLQFFDLESDVDFTFMNSGFDEEYLVICNFTSQKIVKSLEGLNLANFTLFYNNYSTLQNLQIQQELLPYEAQVWKRMRKNE